MKASLKIQVNDRIKRLMEREYSSVDDLKSTIKTAFDLQVPLTQVILSYKDEENEELYIMDEDDLKAAIWNANAKGTNLKISAKVEEDNQPHAHIEEVESEEDEEPTGHMDHFEELKKSIHQIQQEIGMEEDDSSDEEEAPAQDQPLEEANEEIKEEEYRDFKFQDIFARIEDVINTKDKVKVKDIFEAAQEACKGTKAQKAARKFCRKFKKAHCGGPMKALRKFMQRAQKCHMKERCHRKRNAEEAEMPQAEVPNVPISERVHERITCDGCNTTPIVGIRYKCAECQNFDLCGACEEKGVHDHHTFLKVKIPQRIDVLNAFRTGGNERPRHWGKRGGCGGKWRRGCHKDRSESKEEVKQAESPKQGVDNLIQEAFKYQPVLDVLTGLGIDANRAKDALLRHSGDFELAISTASREAPAEEQQPEAEKPKESAAPEEEKSEGRRGCRGKWGKMHGGHHGHHGHGHHGNHWGGQGGHGGHPMHGMMQMFFNQLVKDGRSSSSDSSSDNEQARIQKRKEMRGQRPVVLQQSAINYALQPSETTIVEITVENKTRWPCMVESIKKLEPSAIDFEGLEVGQKLKHAETAKLSIPITMPSQPGHYAIKLGFFGKKGQTGEVLNLEFDVADVSGSSL